MMRPHLVALALCAALCAGADESLIAHYTFDEGAGVIAHDSSGHGHDGRLVGASFVNTDRGFAIDANPTDSGQYVDCGDVTVTGELTICAWVRANRWDDNWDGIVYKSDATYGIRNYARDPGRIHFRAGGRDLISNATLRPRQWHHLAAVFKPSEYMRLYVNGSLDTEVANEIPAEIARDDASLRIGGSGTALLSGTIDEVRVYSRALEAQEVEAVFNSEGGSQIASPSFEEPTAASLFSLVDGPLEVEVYPRGGMSLAHNGETFHFIATFSAPGGHQNCLSLQDSASEREEAGWSPEITKLGDRGFQVTARGDRYELRRRVVLQDGKVEIQDALTNLTDRDLGIVLWNECSLPQPLADWRLYGVQRATAPPDPRTPAINPTCFLSQERGAVGVVIEDDVVRNQLEARVVARLGTLALGTRHLGLPARQQYTAAVSLYPSSADYFEFLNRVRSDWGVNGVTIPGPAAFLRLVRWEQQFYKGLAADHDKFRTFLGRNSLKLFLLCPWFKYWDGFDCSDAEFTQILQDGIAHIKAVEPAARCLGCLETYYYFVPRSILGDTIPQAWDEWSQLPNQFSLPPAARKIIDQGPWRDSVYRDADGNPVVSRRDPGPDVNYKTPPLCLRVYPQVGNHFFNLRMKEIDFLLDEVGCDGVYMDMFGYGGSNYTYHKWDGRTVDIDSQGEITRKYTSLALLTAPAREAWLEHILARGKIALVNFGQPNTRALQRIPYLSFLEGADTGHVDLSAEIPDASAAAGCQLTTPIALGSMRDADAGQLMARVRAFLRYGALYYQYAAHVVLPQQGPGSGEYGPLNHMFPITPVSLHKGWVEGEERTVTTVSGAYTWKSLDRPRVLLFDAVGREKAHACEPRQIDGGWRVVLDLEDWKDIAIIQGPTQ